MIRTILSTQIKEIRQLDFIWLTHLTDWLCRCKFNVPYTMDHDIVLTNILGFGQKLIIPWCPQNGLYKKDVSYHHIDVLKITEVRSIGMMLFKSSNAMGNYVNDIVEQNGYKYQRKEFNDMLHQISEVVHMILDEDFFDGRCLQWTLYLTEKNVLASNISGEMYGCAIPSSVLFTQLFRLRGVMIHPMDGICHSPKANHILKEIYSYNSLSGPYKSAKENRENDPLLWIFSHGNIFSLIDDQTYVNDLQEYQEMSMEALDSTSIW